jgi:hypothetical protein
MSRNKQDILLNEFFDIICALPATASAEAINEHFLFDLDR